MDQKPHDLMNQSAIGLKFLNQKLMRSCPIGPWASDPAVIRVISIKAIKPAVLLGFRAKPYIQYIFKSIYFKLNGAMGLQPFIA